MRFLVLFYGLIVINAIGQPVSREYDLKAAFLYNFAAFINWPETAFDSPESSLVIGVIGGNPFGSALDVITRDERIKGRPIRIRYLQADEVPEGCHMIFICESARREWESIIGGCQKKPVLTVADMDEFIEIGGMIYLGLDSRVRIKINLTAVEAAGLVVSPKLLRIVDVITMPAATP